MFSLKNLELNKTYKNNNFFIYINKIIDNSKYIVELHGFQYDIKNGNLCKYKNFVAKNVKFFWVLQEINYFESILENQIFL